MKRIEIVIILLPLAVICFATPAHTQFYWAKNYGGSQEDGLWSSQQTADGGFIATGRTYSFGAGQTDFWVMKLSSSGSVGWQKTYGGTNYDNPYSIQQTADGGYIVAGSTQSFGAGYINCWVLKLDSSGSVVWQKTYGGRYSSGIAYAIQQTTDGGYIVAGSYSGDSWVLKLDSSGNVLWQKTYGGRYSDIATAIQQTTDGGYIVAGETKLSSNAQNDLQLLKLDSSGNVLWQKTYGGPHSEFDFSIQQTTDGAFIVAGNTDSSGAGNYDCWVLKLDSSGNVLWQKTYGGSWYDYARSIQQTADGGYVVAGDTSSFDPEAGSFLNLLVFEIDANGAILWQNIYANDTSTWASEWAYSIQQTIDGGYIVGGGRNLGYLQTQFLVLKLDAGGNIPGCTMIKPCSLIESTSSIGALSFNLVADNTTAVITETLVSPLDSPAVPLTECTNECYADCNHDGKVNTSDLGIMKKEFLRTNCATVPCQADLDGDYKVNTADLSIMKTQFFKTGCPVP